MGQRIDIGIVGPSYHPESCHDPHTILPSLRIRGNVTTEVEHKSFRVQQFNKEQSNDSRVDDLTRLEELRKTAFIQSAKHQQAMRPYHMWNVSSCSFQVGDFILQKIQMVKH
jgi:hypothetical protein